MIRFGKKPNDKAIEDYIRHCQTLDFNYPYVGKTRELIDSGEVPQGFRLDRSAHHLGRGRVTFEAASAAVNDWEMFNHPMADLRCLSPQIENGNTVSVLFGTMGLWTINPARIIYRLDECRQKRQYLQSGFAYGTTQGHIAVGEELFMVDWNQATDDVYFRIVVFSRPGSLLAWLGKPYMLLQQQKFRRLAGRAIKQATEARHANYTNN